MTSYKGGEYPGNASRLAAKRPRGFDRLHSVDLLRGIAMIIMVLDHVRIYLHGDSFRISPTDLSQASAAMFLTRWVTHPAAPIFVFVAGTSVYLQLQSGKSKSEISKLLVKRGLWLIILEFTVVRLSLAFNLDYMTYFGSMQVIWVIGCSMLILAFLVHLPLPVVTAIAVIAIAGHNLLDGIRVAPWRSPRTPNPDFWEIIWLILHQPGTFLLCDYPCPRIRVTYPLIPWFGVMAAGYAAGYLYRLEPTLRRAILVALGIASVTVFMALRWGNLYGDPNLWNPEKNELFTFFSFINVTKYPVSLLFLLLTLGASLCALAWLERARRGPVFRLVITFGQVPLFFYILQFYLAHGLGLFLGFLAGQPVSHLLRIPSKSPEGVGFDLWVVYLFWIISLALLYPPCRWYRGVKKHHKNWWWLRYL